MWQEHANLSPLPRGWCVETELETMHPSDMQLPENGVVFMFGGEEEVSMAYLGAPHMADRLRAEAIYKLLTENNADGKRMMTTVIRGLAVLNHKLH